VANKTCNALFSKMITAMDMIGDLCPNVSLHTTVMIGLLCRRSMKEMKAFFF